MNNDKNQFKKDFVKRLIRFSLQIIELTSNLPHSEANRIIKKQIIRSGTSIGANVVEAKGCASRKDYANFFSHALKSGNETKYWLILTKHTNPTHTKISDKLLKECEEICKIIASSLMTLRGKK